MATTDTLCFGDHDPVTGPPKIDGLVDYDYLTFDAAEPFETGYVAGSRLTYEGGGLPRVVFQGVRVPATDTLFFGFMCRFDNYFNFDDLVVLALRSSQGSGAERLVAIYPHIDNVGPVAGSGVGPNHIKSDIVCPADRCDFWSRNGGAQWTPIAQPAGVQIKLRSWEPTRPEGATDEVAWSVEIAWPRVTGGFTLNDDFGLYFDVVRVLSPGMTVQSCFPTGLADLGEEPGVGFTVPGYGHGLIPGIQVPPGKNTGLGVHFHKDLIGVGRRQLGSPTTSLTGQIEGPGGASDNEIVALLQNTGVDPANDVWAEFRFYNYGLPPAQFPAWDLGAGMDKNPSPRRVGVGPFDPPFNIAGTNDPNAPVNGVISTAWLRANVPTQYATHKHQCIWVQLESATGVNFNQSSIRRNMDFDHFSDIERAPEISGEGYPKPADGSGEHDFVLQTFCRKIVVNELLKPKLVDPQAQALIDGVLGVRPPREGNQTTEGVPPKTTASSAFKDTVVYIWMAQGYRRTGTFMKIRGNVYENLDHTPGEFGIIARHEGINDSFHYAFDGPGLVQYAPGSYGLKVPHKGRTTIKLRLGTDREGKGGDMSNLPKAPWPKPEGVSGGPGTDDPGTPGTPGTTPDLPKGCLAALFGLFGKKA